MVVIDFILLSCQACGELRKAKPGTVYEPASLEWPMVKPLKCPKCKDGKMKPVPEYGQPMHSTQAFGLIANAADVAWMA